MPSRRTMLSDRESTNTWPTEEEKCRGHDRPEYRQFWGGVWEIWCRHTPWQYRTGFSQACHFTCETAHRLSTNCLSETHHPPTYSGHADLQQLAELIPPTLRVNDMVDKGSNGAWLKMRSLQGSISFTKLLFHQATLSQS